jgi:hypothetical protein
VDEWRAATEYNGYASSDPVIVWWWRALKSFNREERAKVLSFATGTSRVPLGGFVDLQGVQGVQRFSIHRAYGDPSRLPQAHTCACKLAFTDTLNGLDTYRATQALTRLTCPNTHRMRCSASSCCSRSMREEKDLGLRSRFLGGEGRQSSSVYDRPLNNM